ncbi:hypothetical protein CMUS01_02528 [Colletotrichum musicola]|uniref:Uncharacterized protein n=1 Tax=Colletotrichum musicola TaxID=2175873 RepID=A0A8H6NUT4_9PEZI|nr:hypothetical protein CMUS01_02528 [Colletotrichum musicola]
MHVVEWMLVCNLHEQQIALRQRNAANTAPSSAGWGMAWETGLESGRRIWYLCEAADGAYFPSFNLSSNIDKNGSLLVIESSRLSSYGGPYPSTIVATPSPSIDTSVADDTDGTNDSSHVEPAPFGHRDVRCHGQIEKAATNADWNRCKQRWLSTPIYVSRQLRYPQRAAASSRRSGRHRGVKETKSDLIITAVRNRPAQERSSP